MARGNRLRCRCRCRQRQRRSRSAGRRNQADAPIADHPQHQGAADHKCEHHQKARRNSLKDLSENQNTPCNNRLPPIRLKPGSARLQQCPCIHCNQTKPASLPFTLALPGQKGAHRRRHSSVRPDAGEMAWKCLKSVIWLYQYPVNWLRASTTGRRSHQ